MQENSQTLSKWHNFSKLTQVVRELGVKQSMFNLNSQGPDDERFTGSIETPFSTMPVYLFQVLTTILMPYVGRPIYEVTLIVASLGEVGQWQTKGIRSVKTLKRGRAGNGPIWVHLGDANANVGLFVGIGVDK